MLFEVGEFLVDTKKALLMQWGTCNSGACLKA